MSTASRPIRARIDLSALRHNQSKVYEHAPGSFCWSVIKANAYGHGDIRVAKALEGQTDGFAVLELETALRLRKAGIQRPILLLEGPFHPDELPVIYQHEFHIVIHGMHQLAWLRQYPPPPGFPLTIKINTGMNRLGFCLRDLPELAKTLSALPNIRVTLATHFSTADNARDVKSSVPEQMGRFAQMRAILSAAGLTISEISLANSAAILGHPESTRIAELPVSVRPGIMLYGSSPFGDRSADSLGLRSVMSLESEIIAVQTIEAGDAVGYGGSFVATQPMRIGVVACGYADGYPRHAPTGTPVAVSGKISRTLGRVSMDMLACDLSDLTHLGVGSPVTLWGSGHGGSLPVDDVALSAGTISYELLSALAPRVPVEVVG